MPLARLENLLKNLNGNILYVDPAQLDSTDSIENKGNSALRPFKTIQRALLEAVRFSYVQGPNNDLFDQTTILISPGTHYIDNRPGYYVSGTTIKNYSGSTVNLNELTLQSIMDLTDPDNELYKYNSADGGVIIPRGVSLVASDLRKTKIRPKYVPSPTNDLVERSSIFRLTGSCYIYGFSIFDGNPNGNVYSLPSSTTQIPPSYSHHKLTAFEYVDGKNKYVKSGSTLDKTDLEMYYYKVAKGFGQNSGIPNIIDWGVSTSPDLYPNIEENRIVGDLGLGVYTISEIYAGNGDLITPVITNVVTVTTASEHNLSPNTSIVITNVGSTPEQIAEYNGSYTVAQVISPTSFTYRLTANPTSSILPTVNSDSSVSTASDTVSSSSPYVFNCSLKSVYGLNGLHADGSKATGFKSIVTAQFTGISLQKDDNAFVIYNEQTGTYNDQTSFPDEFLHQNSRAIYKPDWESFHIKASNDAFIQCVSIFAIGYSKHFVADNGGDQSITNSNSNFGAIALNAKGFKNYELEKDNHAFITHIIPPKDIPNIDSNIRCLKIDSAKTGSVDNPTRVYLKDYNNVLNTPPNKFKQFSVGGKNSDKIYVDILSTTYNATVSPNYKLDIDISSIDDTTNTITLSQSLTVGSITGINTAQAVRIVSNNGIYPDGIEPNTVYYINQSLTTNTIQLSTSETSSFLVPTVDENGLPVNIVNLNTIGATSGNLRLVSKVSDRISGSPASPIQFDASNGWYINISSNQSFIDAVSGANDPTFYIKRVVDNRNLDDRLYRARVVIPKESRNASDPSTGFILQRSSTAISENYTKTGSSSLTSVEDARNTNQIVDAWVVSGTPNVAHIVTKYPHNLESGNLINIYNLKSSNEPDPIGIGTGTGYNGNFSVLSVLDDIHFTYEIEVDPGDIEETTLTTKNTWMNVRNCSSSSYRIPPYTIENSDATRENLPYFTCEQINNDFQLYKINTIQKYSFGVSDGIYYGTLNAFKNIPSVSPFNLDELRFSQNIENLYPSIDQDNIISDPYASKSIASRKIIGKVDVNDVERSVSKETLVQFLKEFGTGVGISSISTSGSTCTITTTKNHRLGGISILTIPGGSAGTGYVNGTWNDIPLCGGSGSGATAIIVVSGGAVTSASISNPGSGYVSGESVTVKGIPHTTTDASSVNITVSSVSTAYKAIQILGSINTENDGFFPVVSYTENTITYSNSNGVNESYSDLRQSSVMVLSHDGLQVQSLSYNSSTNSTTVTLSSAYSPHSVSVGNKVYFNSIPSTTFDVISSGSSSTFVVSGNASSPTSSVVYVVGLSPSLKDSNKVNENLSSRNYPLLGEVSTRLNSAVTQTASSIIVTSSRGFYKSDFIQINDEIMMITRVSGTGIYVIRGLFGTKQSSHINKSIVSKIKPIPVELRRNSVLRASGHTFEYTGFGPGNYSTGMPTNQNRVLTSDEVLISQSLTSRGGSVLYTGMNSDGEFYIGRKKFNALTGEEELLGIPTAESAIDYADDLTVNNLTVITELDASTAIASIKDLDVGGTLDVIGISTFSNTKDSTSTTTGSVVVSGGVGIAKTVNIGGDLNVVGDLTVSSPSTINGYGTIPIGGIIMWSGSIVSIPTGWSLCNGSNGTPDLRDKFVVGAGSGYSVAATGGSADAVVVSHTHIINDPGHTHPYDTQNSGGGGGGMQLISQSPANRSTGISTTGITIDSSGESGTNKNLPPYFAIAFIMRVS